jgi:hypothetical protein
MPVPLLESRGLRFVVLCYTAWAIGSCGGEDGAIAPPDSPAVATVEVEPSALSLAMGESAQLDAILKARAIGRALRPQQCGELVAGDGVPARERERCEQREAAALRRASRYRPTGRLDGRSAEELEHQHDRTRERNARAAREKRESGARVTRCPAATYTPREKPQQAPTVPATETRAPSPPLPRRREP